MDLGKFMRVWALLIADLLTVFLGVKNASSSLAAEGELAFLIGLLLLHVFYQILTAIGGQFYVKK